jgi:hypothetical protein
MLGLLPETTSPSAADIRAQQPRTALKPTPLRDWDLAMANRVIPMVDFEAGIFTAFDPIPATCNRSGCYNGDNRFLWVPFGARFVIPVGERVELSAGGGGLYERFSVSNPNPALGGRSYTGWGRIHHRQSSGRARSRQALLAWRHAAMVSREFRRPARPLVYDWRRLEFSVLRS